jgi:hypothetical protein
MRFRHEHLCYQGTRIEVLNEILLWCRGDSEQNIYWLRGMAGTGKSTISRTVADQLVSENLLGGSYFFSRGQGGLASAVDLVTTLAVQLSRISSAYEEQICEALAAAPQVTKRTHREQWNQLILGSLKETDVPQAPSNTVVFVIDALDECDNSDDVCRLLQLFSEAKDLHNVKIRVFVTSRPETFINLGFEALPDESHLQFVLHDVPPGNIEQDLKIFFSIEFEDIRRRKKKVHDWPSEIQTGELVSKAGGLFIFAATSTRFIRESRLSPDTSIALILDNKVKTTSVTRSIDSVYTTVLHNSLLGDCEGEEKEILLAQFKLIVGTIVTASDALTQESLSELLQIPLEDVETALQPLQSVLNIPNTTHEPVRLLHPSFRDYLLDAKRCPAEFYISEAEIHVKLAKACLRAVSKLDRDICGLKDPGVLVEDVDPAIISQNIPPYLRYACLYWFHHSKLGGNGFNDGGDVHVFLLDHLLHWLEALGWLGVTHQSILIMSDLLPQIKVLAYFLKKRYNRLTNLIDRGELRVIHSRTRC